MSGRDASLIAAVALMGLGLYLYSQEAGASAPDDSGATADPFGLDDLGGGLFDTGTIDNTDSGSANSTDPSIFDLSSLFGTSPAATPDGSTPPDATLSIIDQIGKAVTGWKTGAYAQYASMITGTEQRYGIPTDLLARLLYQESRYRADVIAGYNRSPVGALGIAQFMPATAAQFGLSLVPSSYNGIATQTYEPNASIDAAGHYLKQLYGEFNDWKNALAAYNWGPGNVAAYNQGQKPMPSETLQYVAQITSDVPVA